MVINGDRSIAIIADMERRFPRLAFNGKLAIVAC